VGRAPARCGHLRHPQFPSLFYQAVPQVKAPGPPTIRGHAAALHHLRTYLIAITADPYATMHYDLRHIPANSGYEALHSATENSAGGAPPAGVEQGDPPPWCHQVHWNAVGDGYREENPWSRANPAVDPLHVNPTAALVQGHDFNPVNLIAEHDGLELRHFSPEGKPAAHSLAHRFPAPQAEVESTTRLGAAAGDTGDDAELFSPAWDLVSGNGSREVHFAEL
jgi:hypothetical protein